jgi:hypothetical protein
MPDANRVPLSCSPPGEGNVVRIVEAQVSALRVQLAVLAEVVRLLPDASRRSAVTETVGAIAHNLGELAKRLRQSDGPR